MSAKRRPVNSRNYFEFLLLQITSFMSSYSTVKEQLDLYILMQNSCLLVQVVKV